MASVGYVVGALVAAVAGLAGGYLGYGALRPSPEPPALVESKDFRYSIRTDPYGATITVDGQVIGKAPMVLTFSPTKEKPQYQVTISHPGYTPKDLTLRPEKDEETTVTLEQAK